MSAAPTPASPIEALKAGFRRACVRRLVGDEEGAVTVLRDEIPGLVVGWAKSTSLDPSEKKAKLKEMFDDESGRADELAVAFDLFAGRFETRVAELVRKEVSSLTNYISQMSGDISSSMKQFELTLEKFDDLATSSAKTPSKIETSKIEDAPVVEQNIPTPLPLPVTPKSKKSSKPAASPSNKTKKIKNKDLEVGLERDLITSKDKQEQIDLDLDTPMGTGLRFDEIEEMIDEILSYESKK